MKIHVANPHDKPTPGISSYRVRPWVLWFGACAPTLVLVYADSLDTASEIAAEYCVEQGWHGLVEPTEDSYENGMMRDALEDTLRDYCDMTMEQWLAMFARADLTEWEVGFTPSWEWGVYAEDPTKEQLIEISRR